MAGWLTLELSAEEVVSSRNSQFKVNRKKMEREYFVFFLSYDRQHLVLYQGSVCICIYTLLSFLDNQLLSTRAMLCLALHPTYIPKMIAVFVSIDSSMIEYYCCQGIYVYHRTG